LLRNQTYFGTGETGYSKAQRNLAIAYEKGTDIGKDLTQAYKWYALAAKKKVKGTAKRRDSVAKRMTPAQLKQAREQVRQWKPNKS